jgi:anion-transporting  ArsA/GET3 family ATPase
LKSTLETMDKVLEFVAAMRKLNPVNWFRPGANERRKNQAAELLGKLKELDRRNDRIMRMLKTLTSLRLVTIAERPSYEEIRRAADLVKKYVPLEGVVINKLNHDGIDCKYCSTETIHQKKYVKMIEEDEHFKDKRIWRTWRMEDEVIGVDKLLEFAKSLYKDETFETIVRPLRLVGPGDA